MRTVVTCTSADGDIRCGRKTVVNVPRTLAIKIFKSWNGWKYETAETVENKLHVDIEA